MRILVVEDDPLLGDALQAGLKQAGQATDWVRDGVAALHALDTEPYAAVVLDLGLPRLSGMDVLRRLRSQANPIPVLILTARDTVEDRIQGLDTGADDYLIKPFDMGELSARLRALVRRASGVPAPVLRAKLAREMALNLLTPLLYALPTLALLLWIAVGRGLKPLAALRDQISHRAPDNLAPLDAAQAPREVQPLVEQLNTLFRRITDSIENERRFTADAAHELRTPVAAIRAQAQVARGAYDDATRAHALDNVITGCDRAAHLIDQLLTLARLDRSQQAPAQSCRLRSLAAEAIAELAPQAVNRGIQLELAEGPEVEIPGLQALLQVLLRNLIDNAIRYNPASTTVQVSVTRETQAARLTVTDQGPGIPAAELPKVRERFYRLLGTGQEGSGLGLSIAQRIAEIHGATLELGAGVDGKGLRVTVTFPVVAPA